MEKVIRDGKVAVLYSPGWGAGWYSWNTDHPQCIFHPVFVDAVEKKDFSKLTEDFVKSTLGITGYFYVGGSYDLEIVWLPQGTRFEITEFDGNEDVKTFDDLTMIA